MNTKYRKYKVCVYSILPSEQKLLINQFSFDDKKSTKNKLKEVVSDYIEASHYPPYEIVFLLKFRSKTGKMKSTIFSTHKFLRK